MKHQTSIQWTAVSSQFWETHQPCFIATTTSTFLGMQNLMVCAHWSYLKVFSHPGLTRCSMHLTNSTSGNITNNAELWCPRGVQEPQTSLHSKAFCDQQTSKWECHQILGRLKSEKLREALWFPEINRLNNFQEFKTGFFARECHRITKIGMAVKDIKL